MKLRKKPKKINVKGDFCLNCGQALKESDNFCPKCGQINDTSRVSLKQYLSDYLSGFLSFDNRFFKTISPLIFKPGKVTREYIEGKRVKYVNPFQLYLHISIVFFLFLGLFNLIDEFKLSNIQQEISKNKEEASLVIDSLKMTVAKTEKEIAGLKVKPDNIKTDTIINPKKGIFLKLNDFVIYDKNHRDVPIPNALDSLGYPKTYWNVFMYSKSKNLNRMNEDPDYLRSYIDHIVSKISIALFFLLPAFALIVALIYFTTKYNYSEHLVFVFHIQTVFFIFLIFLEIVERLFKPNLGGVVFLVVFWYYLYKALRNFYGQGRFITILKFFILNMAYFFIALIGGAVISFLAFFF